MDEASKFIDRNLQQIRWVIAGLGISGVIVIARSIRLATKFRNVASIPQNFFTAQLSLHAKVHNVGPNGHLLVEHIPIVKLPFATGASEDSLTVKLAYVEHTDRSVAWMKEKLFQKPVFIQLLGLEDGDIIFSDVKFQKFPIMFRSLNVHLVKEGLASVEPNPAVPDTPPCEKLYKDMRRAEASSRPTRFWNSWRKRKSTT